MKYAMPAAAVLVLALFLVLGLSQMPSPEPPGPQPEGGAPGETRFTLAEMLTAGSRSKDLEEELQQHMRFRAAFEADRAALWAGKARGLEAADRVMGQAVALCPIYVKTARTRFPELPDREAVLVAMLWGMRTELSIGEAPPGATAAVLEEILCEQYADPDLSPETKQHLVMIEPPTDPTL